MRLSRSAEGFRAEPQFDGWIRFDIYRNVSSIMLVASLIALAMFAITPLLFDPMALANFVLALDNILGATASGYIIAFLFFMMVFSRRFLSATHLGGLLTSIRIQSFDVGPKGVSTSKRHIPVAEVEGIELVEEGSKFCHLLGIGQFSLSIETSQGPVLLATRLNSSQAERLRREIRSALQLRGQ